MTQNAQTSSGSEIESAGPLADASAAIRTITEQMFTMFTGRG